MDCVGPRYLRILLERDADDESSEAEATYAYSMGPTSRFLANQGLVLVYSILLY